jgi:hypothetical protein
MPPSLCGCIIEEVIIPEKQTNVSALQLAKEEIYTLQKYLRLIDRNFLSRDPLEPVDPLDPNIDLATASAMIQTLHAEINAKLTQVPAKKDPIRIRITMVKPKKLKQYPFL